MRATMVAELRLIEAMRSVPGLAMDASPDVELIPQLTPRLYLAAIDRFGSPGLGLDRGADGDFRYVDDARVNATSLRLLAGAFVPGGGPATGPPTGLVIEGGSVRPADDGCVIATGAGRWVARWAVGPNDGFSVRSNEGAHADVLLGVEADGLAAVPATIAALVGDGGPVTPPQLPGGEPWYAAVEADGPVAICRHEAVRPAY